MSIVANAIPVRLDPNLNLSLPQGDVEVNPLIISKRQYSMGEGVQTGDCLFLVLKGFCY